jgi:hypothetical protein
LVLPVALFFWYFMSLIETRRVCLSFLTIFHSSSFPWSQWTHSFERSYPSLSRDRLPMMCSWPQTNMSYLCNVITDTDFGIYEFLLLSLLTNPSFQLLAFLFDSYCSVAFYFPFIILREAFSIPNSDPTDSICTIERPRNIKSWFAICARGNCFMCLFGLCFLYIPLAFHVEMNTAFSTAFLWCARDAAPEPSSRNSRSRYSCGYDVVCICCSEIGHFLTWWSLFVFFSLLINVRFRSFSFSSSGHSSSQTPIDRHLVTQQESKGSSTADREVTGGCNKRR